MKDCLPSTPAPLGLPPASKKVTVPPDPGTTLWGQKLHIVNMSHIHHAEKLIL